MSAALENGNGFIIFPGEDVLYQRMWAGLRGDPDSGRADNHSAALRPVRLSWPL
ncbi:hypothetical protein NBRC3255_1778 [Gluconobacter thailandicus NBRC 3255]|nr:hypothetical protein NBRC3255_1778 [Gluconobacter thailandicus NBRC 3255]